jgi:hypothetical protein
MIRSCIRICRRCVTRTGCSRRLCISCKLPQQAEHHAGGAAAGDDDAHYLTSLMPASCSTTRICPLNSS